MNENPSAVGPAGTPPSNKLTDSIEPDRTAEFVSPVPVPALDAVPPDLYRGIYGMPMFVTIPTPDLAESAAFWERAFGFFDLFSIPGRLTHLRRWAFQDVLLVPMDQLSATQPSGELPHLTVSFACVLSQVDTIAEASESARPGSTSGPRNTAWNTVDVEVVTPENVRVIFTAGKPFDPDSAADRNLREVGISPHAE
ncbi:hypothetical protein GCM10022261_12380 [Brevibacterium daeguense]|uniref:Glycosyltransferase n=1 Tax=Brevibacterium daeguense TaxID=909936 RepID=A0ABP8EIF2_9MICO|nr:VOC family protein [Brevibacterium daeguense]